MNRVAILSGVTLALGLGLGACTAPAVSPSAPAASGVTPVASTSSPSAPSASPAVSPMPAASMQPAASGAAPVAMAEPDGQAVFAKFKAQPDAFMRVSMEGGIPSDFHGGSFHYFVSKPHAAEYKNLKGMAPDGMMVIKQSTSDPNKLYLMQKVKGYDPANQDWYYALTSASDGKPSVSGKAQSCIACHAKWAPTDYLGAPGTPAIQAKLL